ncbi:protein kinase family protein [bacterium]|nr:protein kinase family protein [bacterium]MBU1434344.1 protein kinase family protein [bacterium]MBU1503735.1 protein kinase family protein [bacterium]
MQIYEYFNTKKARPVLHIEDVLTLADGKQYTVDEQLGGGGESYVLKISELTEDDTYNSYAIKIAKTPNKIIKKKLLKNKKFLQEIEIAKEFSTLEYKSNFITYHMDGTLILSKSDGHTKTHTYYVMDLAHTSLENFLCQHLNWTEEQEIFPKIKELSNTIKLLHEKNYVHRDIKPQNILVQGELLKLADFGMVEKENTSCEKSGPKYWPTPELLDMCDDEIHCSGKRTDVFMLGCIFYFIYTKKYPVGDIDINLIANHHKMKPIIKRMISYDQSKRHTCAEEVYNEIKTIRFE